MNNDVLIKVDHVSKRFCRDLKRSLWYGVTDAAREFFPARSTDTDRLRKGEFWANHNISFEVKRGECLGLIGHNGAGKTTLLKMLNGLIKPDAGRIQMRGKVGALIALGAGFNPILTGRENIYVNGSILGLSRKQIDAKLEEIIDFAEIESAIDAPVRTYSSGMQVRLGFAVAAVLVQPDVLLLDEVLAVGDVAFRARCYRRIQELRDSAALVLVSHNLTQIERTCSHASHLAKGQIVTIGAVSDCIKAFEEEQASKGVDDSPPTVNLVQLTRPWPESWLELRWTDCLLEGQFNLSLSLLTGVGDVIGHVILEENLSRNIPPEFAIRLPRLRNGQYVMSLVVYEPGEHITPILWAPEAHRFEIAQQPHTYHGHINLQAKTLSAQ